LAIVKTYASAAAAQLCQTNASRFLPRGQQQRQRRRRPRRGDHLRRQQRPQRHKAERQPDGRRSDQYHAAFLAARAHGDGVSQ
jgi:hypothetical protein